MGESRRSLVAHYLNSTPSLSTEAWELLGEGIASAQIAMNPQTETKQYVHEDLATTRVTGYQPTMPIEMTVYPGDDLFDAIDAIRQAGPSIGSNDVTEFVEARLYEDPDTSGTKYPGTKWNVQIQIDTAPGGDGGADASIGFTINFQGEATDGDFDTDSSAWTDT